MPPRHEPPLPTTSQVREQWDLSLDNVTRLIARIQPQRFDSALCAGKAPMFDLEKFDHETEADHQARLTYIRHHCHACPVTNCPQELT